jgi:hypothetical protein
VARLIGPADKLLEQTIVETQRIVEWLQRLVHVPRGRRNPGLRSGAIDEGRIVAQVATWSEALGGESRIGRSL